MEKRKKERNLKPSLRENKRYLLLENFNTEKVENAILDYVGILGYSKASPQFIKSEKNILAINRKETEKVKAALELANIGVKKVSGTLKSLRK